MSSLHPHATPEELGFDAHRLSRINDTLDAYVADRRLPGYLATVSRGGELAYVAKGGHADRELDKPVQDDTIWRIYSMTKPITSIAAMMLYEEGKFDLNDSAGTWLDVLREPRVYTGGAPSAPQTVPATEPVRIWHLLSHMSGLTYGFTYAHNVDAIYRLKGYEFGWPKGATLETAVNDWCSSPLVFKLPKTSTSASPSSTHRLMVRPRRSPVLPRAPLIRRACSRVAAASSRRHTTTTASSQCCCAVVSSMAFVSSALVPCRS